MAKELSFKTEEKHLNDGDDTSSSHNTFSSLPHEQEQSAKTSISIGSFPQAQISTSSEETPIPCNYTANNSAEIKISTSHQDSTRSILKDDQAVQSLDGEIVDLESPTYDTNGPTFHDVKNAESTAHSIDIQDSAPPTAINSPSLSEKSNFKIALTPSSSPVIALTSWLGSTSHSESKSPLVATPSMESSLSASDFDLSSEFKSSSHSSTAANTFFSVTSRILFEIDDAGYGGGPCSAGATAVLDFMAEVLSDFMTEQLRAAQVVETILENVPLYVDAECMLAFQGLCLCRLMIFLERRLVRDDEEDYKKLDKIRWSSNLDSLCWIIVDRVYMGAFPQPAVIWKTLEFLLSMLQLANKDGRIEEATPTGKGLLSIGRASRQLEAYIHSMLKNTNRMIMYCFLPSFLVMIGKMISFHA